MLWCDVHGCAKERRSYNANLCAQGSAQSQSGESTTQCAFRQFCDGSARNVRMP